MLYGFDPQSRSDSGMCDATGVCILSFIEEQSLLCAFLHTPVASHGAKVEETKFAMSSVSLREVTAEKLVNLLLSKGVIDQHQLQSINSKSNRYLKNEKMLDILPSSPDSAFASFIEALKKL